MNLLNKKACILFGCRLFYLLIYYTKSRNNALPLSQKCNKGYSIKQNGK